MSYRVFLVQPVVMDFDFSGNIYVLRIMKFL
jgi:hypothetical protein